MGQLEGKEAQTELSVRLNTLSMLLKLSPKRKNKSWNSLPNLAKCLWYSIAYSHTTATINMKV